MKGTSIKLSDKQRQHLETVCQELSTDEEKYNVSLYIRKLIALDIKYKIFQQYYGVVQSTTDRLQTTPPVVHDIPKVIGNVTEEIQNIPSANGYNLDDLLKECY